MFEGLKMSYSHEKEEGGYTLVELLIAMAIGCVVVAAIISAFMMQRKSLEVQEQIAEMVQTARAAMDMMGREIRMAGYNPTGATFNGIPYDPEQLQIRADLRGADAADPPDGDTDDPNENIIYAYYDETHQIKRKTGNGYFQPFAENIDGFFFDYLDRAGNTTTTTEDIRQIRITITARTAKRDPGYAVYGGYRNYTLRSLITPINLAFKGL